MGKIKDLKGQKFNRLTVISISGRTKDNSVTWLCKCDCGKEVIVVGQNLSNGNSKSCGCFHNEITSKINKTHGKTKTHIYKVWLGIKRRCTYPNDISYGNYGGRGIKICDRWLTFELFYEDMHATFKKGLSIDRIDVNGNYELSNCKWATNTDQANNKRSNVFATVNGVTDTITNLSRLYNISDRTVFSRIYTGWPIEKAITTPVLNPLDNLKYIKNS